MYDNTPTESCTLMIIIIIITKYVPQLACHDYKVCPKQLEYSSELYNQIGCYLNTKPTGVESCMARVCRNVANFLLK